MHLDVVRGDITKQAVDVVVNAANSSLLGGGGVDGAIHRAAGPELLAQCRELRRTTLPEGLPTGDAVATGAGGLAARHVVHTVGPRRWEHPDGGSDLLSSCFRRSMEVSDALGARSIAFPAISCGAFGGSVREAAPIAVTTVLAFAGRHPASTIVLVRFVLFDDVSRECFAEAVRSALE